MNLSHMQNLSTMEFLYEYAVIRYVPDIERQEFINVGLIMMCKRRRWIRIAFRIDRDRFNIFDPAGDLATLQHQLRALECVAAGEKACGTVAMFEPEERFRWITAVKSACIQTSRPHPGLCRDLDATFDRLLDRYV